MCHTGLSAGSSKRGGGGTASRPVRPAVARRAGGAAAQRPGRRVVQQCRVRHSGLFHTLPPDRESEEVTLNSRAVMELAHPAQPGMVERGAGAVMNVASIGLFGDQGLRADVLQGRPRGIARNGGVGHLSVPGAGAHRVGRDRQRRAFQHSGGAGLPARRRRDSDRGGARRQAQRAAARAADRSAVARRPRPLYKPRTAGSPDLVPGGRLLVGPLRSAALRAFVELYGWSRETHFATRPNGVGRRP